MPSNASHPFARYRMDRVDAQDYMVWETQGPFANRGVERLATSDRGVVMLREMMKREIANVAEGIDPKGIIRDPDHAMIDTSLDVTIAEQRARGTRPPIPTRAG